MDRRSFFKLVVCLPLCVWGAARVSPRRDIVLLETTVAGWRYYEGDKVLAVLHPGAALELRREPFNTHDGMAIAVYWSGTKLGYVPRVDNAVIATFLDQGIAAQAHVLRRHPEAYPWERLEVRITMKA